MKNAERAQMIVRQLENMSNNEVRKALRLLAHLYDESEESTEKLKDLQWAMGQAKSL